MRAPLVFALVLLGIVLLAAFPRNAAPAEFADPVPAEVRERNGAARAALALAGVSSTVAEHDPQRFVIAYQLPAHDPRLSPEDLQRYALGIAARLAPPGAEAVARQQENGTLLREWRVPSEDVLSFLAGGLTSDELEARIQKQDPAPGDDAARS